MSDEVDAWYEHLKAHNVPIINPPATSERYQIFHLFAQDPNGYMVEIQRFDDPNWNR